MAALTEKLILRRASIYANPGNPPDTLPRVRGDLTTGELGVTPCIEIQKWNATNQVFLISDDAIDTTTPTVYIDNVATAAGSLWTFNASNNFEAQGNVATLTFTADQTGKQISVKCKGKKNSAGTLIENLAEIIQDLLVNVHGLAAAKWDSVVYSRVFNDCAELGYVGGGVVLDDIDPVTLADSILKPGGGAYVGSDGKIKLYVEKLPASPAYEELFEDDEIEQFTYTTSIDAIINDLKLNYRFNWRKRRFASLEKHFDAEATNSDAQSKTDFGTRQPDNPLDAPWLRTAAAANTMVTKLLTLRKRPRADIELGLNNYRAILNQPADVIAFTCSHFPGGSASGSPGYRRLIRLNRCEDNFQAGGITLHGIDLQVNAS